MNAFVKLFGVAFVPVVVSIFFYLVEKKTKFGKLNYKFKQILIGIVFGGIAVLGTEFGVDIGGAAANARDSAPLCAGLLFGAPAGIIAGLIGGLERWFAVYWGAGTYTRLACSLSTIFAGFFGAVLRKYMFDNKKPTSLYALGIGIITEVFHMLMIFFTNMNDIERAFYFVEKCSVPMITVNGLGVLLAVFIITLISGEKPKGERRQKQITIQFQRWLLVCVVIAFFITSLFTTVIQAEISENDTENLLTLNLKDVKTDVAEASDRNLLTITQRIAKEIEKRESLLEIAKENNVAEINIVNKKGVISNSTNPSFIGYDMISGEQSRAFLVLLKDKKNYVQEYQPISYDESISRKYAGTRLANGGFVQVGYDFNQFQEDIDKEIVGATRNRHIGENGYLIIADKNLHIVSDLKGGEGLELKITGLDLTGVSEDTRFEAVVRGEPSFCKYTKSEGYSIISVIPKSQAVFSRNLSVYVSVFMEIVVFVGLFILIYFLIKRLVVDNIHRINNSLSKITGGNLNVTVDVRENEEFASLSDDINSTVLTLKQYIAEAAARIDKELEFAKEIQHTSLPTVFPPYPNRTDFEIFAQMDTAKEVGGDFYDFYLTSHDELVFLIADVSGKGIPAAMFMMRARTLIKSYAESRRSVDEVFTMANKQLCENNDAEMFVTAWIGKINLKTGLVTFADAGHNPPLVKHSDGSFEYLKTRPNLVLAGMPGINYKLHELQLQKGDVIYLYTDGVTEATDKNHELYGEDRLLNVLNKNANVTAKDLCKKVKADVDLFVGDADQFDDITMLTLKYFGENA